MLKKIVTLSIVIVVVLIGVENLIAQEGTGEPQTEPRQRQVQEGRQRQRGRTEQPRRQQVDSEAQAKRAEAMRMKRLQEALQKKRQQEAAKKAGTLRERVQRELLQKKWQQSRKGRLPAEAAKKGAPKGRISREPQQTRPGQNRPMQQMFGRYLDELTKAYRDNDRKKMGQLLRKMQQLRQKLQQARATAGQRGPGFRGRDIMGRGGRGFPPRGMGGWGRGYPGGGIMSRGGRGFQDRRMGRRPGPRFPGPKPEND